VAGKKLFPGLKRLFPVHGCLLYVRAAASCGNNLSPRITFFAENERFDMSNFAAVAALKLQFLLFGRQKKWNFTSKKLFVNDRFAGVYANFSVKMFQKIICK
jgi:hypothetical protein